MAIKVALNHKTTYKFDRLVGLSPHVFRLRPAAHSRTKIEAYSIKITPENHFINWQQDPFGNFQARVVFPDKTNELYVEVDIIANLEVINPFDFFVEEYADNYPFTYDNILLKELGPYLEPSEDTPLLKQWVKNVNLHQQPIVDFLVGINQKLWKDISYTVRLEPGVQTSEETLAKSLGSCRDTAWLMVQVMRHLGLAARFVSGYLVQLTADTKPLDGPSGPASDFTDLHAWCEVYIPGAGWIGLDATSGLFAGEGHIPLACTPEPASAAPVTGLVDKCQTIMEYSNTVVRIHEDPRVSKPYTEDQWTAIMALGNMVDRDLQDGDVRLTMGGEPTFVSIDDMESAQWNTAADGDHKRKLANELTWRLKNTFSGHGGMLHYGMGKWYPGEELPRWQYGIYWRKDRLAMWQNQAMLANINTDYNFTNDHANSFIGLLAKKLQINAGFIVTAYEDVFYYVWSEGRIPIDIDPQKKNLKDPLERQYLADLLQKGINKPTGFIIPIMYSFERNKWFSSIWKFRKGNCFLIPGNSPLGLRIPLDSLKKIQEVKEELQIDTDLFSELPDLQDFYNDIKELKVEEDPDQTIRTAISVEARQGRLHVFFPPLKKLENYLELLSFVEATATQLGYPVIIEGYEPPKDYRIEKLVVTPDPGVIEVNVHPANTWVELTENYQKLFEDAKQSRLGTEKFMTDGRHTGSGGGNHITIGGAKPSDSPLLRRPDLLRSLITYWQHHPGLSYLFAGSFIGPTSQAPRVDEGRDEKLYELEIAFSQIPEKGELPFWLTDRLLRHLLVDITGNTHRAEFCIDKLYSPDSSSGRLGILEFRAFDMPPHYQMGMVQMLLIRSLIAMFWEKPYHGKLVRWGTELHDRFLIPHYCKEDMKDVVNDLNSHGYPFQMNWLDPFFEFRFPHFGSVQIGHMALELRMAIEPWHVLGEEATSSGTARYVDSSLERIQVKITGLTGNRHILLCNGKRIPLKNTGTVGDYVAAVRYKAWNPPSALHPTIQVQSPLVFDLVDTWSKRAIGGCKYFVTHPGGRSYDTFPVNSFEAESRRINRFWDYGHTPSTTREVSTVYETLVEFVPEGSNAILYEIPQEVIDEEYAYTTDLRKTE